MPNYRRDQTAGGTWFFTAVAFKRRPIFCDDKFRASLRPSIQRTQQLHPFQINGWVLLPDHMHCVWTLPKDDRNFSLRWKLIKQFVTRSCRKHYQLQDLTTVKGRRRESGLWQRRFWEHRIRNEKDLETHLDYLHFNPVKHGYCHSPADWPYSSIHRYQTNGIYPEDWASEKLPNFNSKINFGDV